jgi:hypothetical protein
MTAIFENLLKILMEGSPLPSIIVILFLDLIIVIYAANFIIRRVLEYTEKQISLKDDKLIKKDELIEKHSRLLTEVLENYHDNIKQMKTELSEINEKLNKNTYTLEIISVRMLGKH